MKTVVILIASLMNFQAFAGTAITSEQFNDIIKENMEIQKDLSQKLQKAAGIDEEKVVGRPSLKIAPGEMDVAPENVAATSSSDFDQHDVQVVSKKTTEKRRVSQEVKEALSN